MTTAVKKFLIIAGLSVAKTARVPPDPAPPAESLADEHQTFLGLRILRSSQP
jgi:hypothetical protein